MCSVAPNTPTSWYANVASFRYRIHEYLRQRSGDAYAFRIVSLATSYDGVNFSTLNEVASPYNFDDIEYLYDWWEGEKFIKLFGIKSIAEIKIEGGIYEEDE